MAVTPTGSDGTTLPVKIVSSDVSFGSSEKTTLAASATLDELYKIALTGTGQASSPSISLIQKNGGLSIVEAANTWTTVIDSTSESANISTGVVASQVLKITSSSANDASAGTGARTVKIWGLNSSYAEISETVTLNGTSAVNTANSYIAVNHMQVMTVGSGGVNAGAIQLYDNASAIIMAAIPTGLNVASGVVYTVPAGKTLLIHSISASIGLDTLTANTVGVAEFRFKTSKPADVGKIYAPQFICTSSSPGVLSPSIITVPEKTSFTLQAKGHAITMSLYVAFKGILIGSVLTATDTWL